MKKITYKFMVFLSIFALFLVSTPFSSTARADTVAATTPKCDQAFYSSNDILFYNPCATSCSTAPSGAGNAVSSLRGKNNGEKIFNFWLDAGLTSQEAAGITASLQAESGFSAFRQEMPTKDPKTGQLSPVWPNGGWGIAQFTDSAPGAGERTNATTAVKTAVGDTIFNQYYIDANGGPVLESNNFVPTGVPPNVNDAFLLAELNYLLSTVRTFVPPTARADLLKTDYKQSIGATTTLYDYLKTIVQAPDAAIAWTYLYEYPDLSLIKDTAAKRGSTAADILTMYGNGIATTCGGGLQAGGMTLDQAKAFMDTYKNDPSNTQYIGGAGTTCSGGPLANCVSFSTYFINKYTSLKGFGKGTAPGNGGGVVGNIIARNPSVKSGHSPQPYAIFSTRSGHTLCGNVLCGHTGVILGVDTVKQKVIVGEAACGSSNAWTNAHEYALSKFDSDTYSYAYVGDFLKAGVN